MDRKLIKDTSFLVIDFETITPKGISPEPIELGVLRINGTQIDKKAAVNYLIKPPKGLHLTNFDTDQTGIRESDLSDKPTAEKVISILNNACKRTKYIFIAQNAKYEANILSKYTGNNESIKATPIIDTILLAKNVFPELDSYKLDILAKNMNINIPTGRHRALEDCFLTAEVFIGLLERKKEIIYIDNLLKIAQIQPSYQKPEQMKLFDFPR
ncbi:MAG: 3'-5' exonuclease [Oscillospiraceae bacterium]|nr:3'-5' exonuclease [Oscillospiraceae bacterium]